MDNTTVTKKKLSIKEKITSILKKFWRQKGKPSIIAAKHSEFMIEPTIFIGNQLNPEILKLLVVNYLRFSTKQDSGTGTNIEVTPERLVIKNPEGKPLVVVRDKKIIYEYLTQKA